MISGLENDEIIESEHFSRGGYSDFSGETAWNNEFETIDDVEGGFNIEVNDGLIEPIINKDLESPLLKEVKGISDYNHAFKGSQTQLVKDGSSIFYVYSWTNGTNHQVSIIGSYDSGNTWTSAVDIWQGTARYIRLTLHKWNSNLYVFIIRQMPDRTDSKLYMKTAPISKWTDLKTTSLITVQDSLAIKMDVTSDDDYMYLISQIAGDLSGNFLYYDGQSWSSPVEAVSDGYCGNIGIEVAHIGATTKIMFFYSRYWEAVSVADGNLHMKYSTNLGSTWSSYGPVMSDDNDYYFVNCININGTHVLFSDHKYGGNLTMVISRDNGVTWTDEMNLVTTRGLSTLLPHYTTSYSASYDENIGRLYLIYEDSADRIRYIYSDDYGSNWISEANAVTISSYDSFDPLVCSDSSLISYMCKSGSNFNAKLKWLNSFEPSSGFETMEYSPPMLSSWDHVGFDISIQNGTYVHYRVLDGNAGSVLYPLSSSWINLSSLDAGDLNGISFNYTDSFSGDWTGPNPALSISVEIRLYSLGMMSPSVHGIYLDYSTSMPYDEDFTHTQWVESYDTGWESSWMNHSGGQASEKIVTEQIEKESGSWPNTLMMEVEGLDDENYVNVGLLDPNTGEYITGFTPSDFDTITIPTSQAASDLSWDGSFLGDLSAAVNSFAIEVELYSGSSSASPALDRIWMAGNEPPKILDIQAVPSWDLYRTDMVTFGVSVNDDHQSSLELTTVLEYRRPGSVNWEDDLLIPIEPLNNILRWILTIPADAEVGDWAIRANTTDGFREFSGYVLAGNVLTVKNRAPTVLIDSGEPLHFDEDTIIGPINMSDYFFDGDNDKLEYTHIIEDIFSLDRMESIINITAPDNWYGAFTIDITASDGMDENSTSIDIVVDPINDPPEINGIKIYGEIICYEIFNYTYTLFDNEFYDLRRIVNITLPEDDVFTFGIDAFDIDGDDLTYAVSGGLFDQIESYQIDQDPADPAEFTFIGGENETGIIWLYTEVFDGIEYSDLWIQINITQQNDPPTGEIITPTESVNLEAGHDITMSAVGYDIDGDPLNFTWKEGELTIGEGSSITYNWTRGGIHEVACYVSDGSFEVLIGTVKINVFIPTPPYSAEDLERSYDCPDGTAVMVDFSGNMDDPGKIRKVYRSDIDGIEILKLESRLEGEDLIVTLTLKGVPLDSLSDDNLLVVYNVYFVKGNWSEPYFDSTAVNEEGDGGLTPSESMYYEISQGSFTTDALYYGIGFLDFGDPVVDGNKIIFTLPISDLEESAVPKDDFNLYAHASYVDHSDGKMVGGFDTGGYNAQDSHDIKEEGEDDPFPWWILVIVIVLIIAVIVTIVLVAIMMNKKGEEEDAQPEMVAMDGEQILPETVQPTGMEQPLIISGQIQEPQVTEAQYVTAYPHYQEQPQTTQEIQPVNAPQYYPDPQPTAVSQYPVEPLQQQSYGGQTYPTEPQSTQEGVPSTDGTPQPSFFPVDESMIPSQEIPVPDPKEQ